ncbi:ATP-binding cassette sub-family C member 2 [Rhipicephalus microplus]|uniref:ATP-binding cassette sub-family C member 2 n=1 Tax=Rhipicephalus microplus TaxID=6941 RepID=UPI003F6AC008
MDYEGLQTSVLVRNASWLLKWAFVGCSLFSIVELLQRPQLAPRRPVCYTLCDLGYLVCNIVTIVFLVVVNALVFDGSKEAATECVMVIIFVWLTFSALMQRIKGMSASNLFCTVHAMYFVACVNDLLCMKDLTFAQAATYHSADEFSWATTWCSLSMVAALGSLLFACFRSSPVYIKDSMKVQRNVSDETLSPLAKCVGAAVFRHIINAGLYSVTVEGDIFPLMRRLKSRLLVRNLRSSPLKWTGRNSGFHVFCGFLRVLWYEALWVILAGFAFYTNYIIRVPLLEALIEKLGCQPATTALTVLFLSTCVAEVFLSGFMEYVVLRLSLQMKALMQAALFTKTTRMSGRALSENPTGYLVSLVGVDCEELNMAAIIIFEITSGLLCFPVLLWMLAKRVGVLPVIGCVAWQLVSLALFVPVSKVQTGFWKRVNRQRDERLKKMADTLSCVRLVKFYAWEDALVRAMNRFRERETFFIFLANLLDGFVDSLQVSSSSLMTIILLGTFAAVNRPATLTAARSFSSLYMLSIMDIVAVNISACLRHRSMVSEGVRRMVRTLTGEEECIKKDQVQPITLKKGAVSLSKCSLAWSGAREETGGNEKPVLCGVTMDVEPGSFVGVVGLVGSGKSALLAAMLGELRCVDGDIHVHGSVAYLPQAACIFNMTIRDNVLFGKRMDVGRYLRVLEACDLTRDMELLPAGDLTEVGEKAREQLAYHANLQEYKLEAGETLSGGQKQRVALARAVYSDSDIYLMDDTLSALDVHVAAKVFARVIGREGLLNHKTRIMVCNQGVFLRHVEQLFLVWEKRLLSFRTLAEMVTDDRAPKTLLFGSKTDSSDADRRPSGYSYEMADEDGVFGKLTADETRNRDLFWCLEVHPISTLHGPANVTVTLDS